MNQIPVEILTAGVTPYVHTVDVLSWLDVVSEMHTAQSLVPLRDMAIVQLWRDVRGSRRRLFQRVDNIDYVWVFDCFFAQLLQSGRVCPSAENQRWILRKSAQALRRVEDSCALDRIQADLQLQRSWTRTAGFWDWLS